MRAIIKPETEADIPAIYEVNKLAFGQEDEAKLVDALRESDAFVPGLSLIATMGGEVVGHILFTKIKIRGNRGSQHDSLALAPMAVLPAFQKQGIGSQLIWHGLAKAKELGYKSVIVLGHEHYYPKFGFVPAIKWNIKAPIEVPSNIFMGIELVRGGFKKINGTVEYPKEFGIA
jgi:putative acetyltransferase